MKKYIIKYWILSYDTKVFGAKYRGLRVVNTLIVLICLAGLYNLLTPGFDIWQGIAFIPFVVVAVYTERYVITKDDLQYLDWEQELQLMEKPKYVKKKWDFVLPEYKRKDLVDRYEEKYRGKERFVEAIRFFHPFAWIVITCIVFAIFGFNEIGFPELRGF